MSGLGIMVLTLLLLVFMATSHQDAGEKQATQRDAVNVRRRRSIAGRTTTEECDEYCEDLNKNCCGLSNGEPVCATACLG
uniref:Conotoxin TsMSGL-2 n=1 Tax=Conus tessulatus TaxID=101317 RepID=O367_CONTS|nr:RecName: Full=Conotoxin TsMSGL-2; Flags: Precursor [Conus tessulatus]AAG60493.1 conotoxin scaffold VI/VII precursor [Conus tessulatus]